MNIAHIVPIPHLSLIKGNSTHMCLASIAKKYPEYKRFYDKEARYTILDNGMFEGEMLAPEELLEVAVEINSVEIVIAPDYLRDCDATLGAAQNFSKLIYDEGLELATMIVPHGANLEELKRCFVQAEQLPPPCNILYIGFSYLAFESATNSSRLVCASTIFSMPYFPHMHYLHLLGISKKPWGLAEVGFLANAFSNPITNNSTIEFSSLDTSLAATLTYHNLTVSDFVWASERGLLARPKNFFELELDETLLRKNMEQLECLINPIS